MNRRAAVMPRETVAEAGVPAVGPLAFQARTVALRGDSRALRSLAGGIGLFLAMAVASGAEPVKTSSDDPKPSWRSGPVRNIITDDEDKEFKGLKTDEQRKSAIDLFWSRRDPTPLTPENEYKDDFYKRLEDANKEFGEGSGSGWTTDRGRYLLTAGYPAQREKQEDREIWTYSRPELLKLRAGSSATSLKVTFQKNENGEFRMDSDGLTFLNGVRKIEPIELVKATIGPIATSTAKGSAPKGTTAPGAAPAGGPGAAGAAVASELPPGIERLRQATLESAGKDEMGVVVGTRKFLAQDGTTDIIVDVAVKRSDVAADAEGKPATLLYARLQPLDPPGAKPIEAVDQGDFTFYDDEGEGWYKYAFSISLKPGEYELRAAASDGPEGKIATRTVSQTLPNFGPGTLSISSVTFASVAEPAPAGASEDDPFIKGTLRLIPRATPTLGPGEDLSFFYDVYNAQKNASNGKPSLDVTYTFEKKDAGSWKKMFRNPLVLPDQQEETLGYTFPAETISRWPAGDWRLTIDVKDKLAGAAASTTLEFSITK